MSPTVPSGADGELLTAQELAKYLAIGEQTLRKWCAQGDVPHGRIGGLLRFDRGQIQEWLDARWSNGRSVDLPEPGDTRSNLAAAQTADPMVDSTVDSAD